MDKTKVIIFVAVVLVVLIAATGGAYYYLTYQTNKPEPPTVTQTKTNICGDLLPQTETSGKAPFAPVLKATINGAYKASERICEWSINGTTTHQSYPVKGQCIFGGKPLNEVGTYAIGYRIAGQSCSKSVTINVQ
jgi:hypothetical protein